MQIARPTRNVPISITLALGFALSVTGIASAGTLPVPENCADTNPGDSGAQMKCMFGNVLAQQSATADMIGQLPNTTEGQMQRIRNEMGRNTRGMNRTPGMDFRELTKKKQAQCQIREIEGDGIGNDDGLCTGNEACMERIGDQIGDDIQPCRTRGNPAQREVCVEICDNEAINANPDNFDDDPNSDSRGRDMAEMLTDLTDQNIELNEMLAEEMARTSSARTLAQGGEECAVAILARRNTLLLAGFSGATVGAKAAADLCSHFGNLDISGFNVSPVCAIPEGIATVAVILSNAFLFEDGVIDSDTIDATLGCVQTLNEAAEETQAQLDEVQKQLATVQEQLEVVQQQLGTTLRLIRTPTGRREGFNERESSSPRKAVR